VTFAAPALLAAFGRELRLDRIELWTDPDRAAYRAFGFGRASVARVWLDPRVWRRYARLLRAGRRLHRPAQDPQQLGGDVVLDADGRVAWLRRSRGPEDRPPAGELLAALAAARGGG
jgi:hypothetical protein